MKTLLQEEKNMLLAFVAIIVGLVVLIWSADKFVDGAAATAKIFGMPTLLIGMVIVGFGTSAPEMVVSAFASLEGNPGIALGNAYGSNIANIALILGVSAMMSPIALAPSILRKELPQLAFATLVTVAVLYNLYLSRLDAAILLLVFAAIMAYTIRDGIKNKDTSASEAGEDGEEMTLKKALMLLLMGLVFLIASSRIFVWGAVEIATLLGVSDMIIGLTIVALGTSLPELASSVMAAKKNEHDIALGNVIGSNLFNTLAVVGIAGSIHPFVLSSEILTRDMVVMCLLTFSLFIFGIARKNGVGRINRFEGFCLLLVYVAYNSWLIYGVMAANAVQ